MFFVVDQFYFQFAALIRLDLGTLNRKTKVLGKKASRSIGSIQPLQGSNILLSIITF